MAEDFIPVNGTNPAKSLHTRTHDITAPDGSTVAVHDEVIDQGTLTMEVSHDADEDDIAALLLLI